MVKRPPVRAAGSVAARSIQTRKAKAAPMARASVIRSGTYGQSRMDWTPTKQPVTGMTISRTSCDCQCRGGRAGVWFGLSAFIVTKRGYVSTAGADGSGDGDLQSSFYSICPTVYFPG